MRRFEQGDVVRVPFPYTDRETRQRRPRLRDAEGGTRTLDAANGEVTFVAFWSRCCTPSFVKLAQLARLGPHAAAAGRARHHYHGGKAVASLECVPCRTELRAARAARRRPRVRQLRDAGLPRRRRHRHRPLPGPRPRRRAAPGPPAARQRDEFRRCRCRSARRSLRRMRPVVRIHSGALLCPNQSHTAIQRCGFSVVSPPERLG
jgi:hypothetical protein